MRMLLRTLIYFVLTAAVSSGCKSLNADSETKGLFKYQHSCGIADQETQRKIAERADFFLKDFAIGQRPFVYTALSKLPGEYLEWIIKQSKRVKKPLEISGVPPYPDDPRTLGVEFGYEGNTYYIRIHPELKGQVATNIFLHELGHAIEQKLQSPTFNAALLRSFAAESKAVDSIGQGRQDLGSYGLGNPTEFFAELFDSWYCSEASLAQIAAQAPCTYSLFKDILLPPANFALPKAQANACATIPTSPRKGALGSPQYSLGIEMGDPLPDGGVPITKITAGSEAAIAGLAAGDIVMGVNSGYDFDVTSQEQLRYEIKNNDHGIIWLRIKKVGAATSTQSRIQLTPIPGTSRIESLNYLCDCYHQDGYAGVVGSKNTWVDGKWLDVRLKGWSLYSCVKMFSRTLYGDICKGLFHFRGDSVPMNE